MSSAKPSSTSTVLIAIGPEWVPLHYEVQSWLSQRVFALPTAIALLDPTPSKPAGRVACWIAGEGDARLVVPGQGAGNELGGIWCGVTELLLDPDPTQAEQVYALGIWTRFASRMDRLKMRVSSTLPDDIVTRAEQFAPVLAALVGEWRGQRVVITGRDIIAAEVTARAFRSVAQPAGDIGLSPWQSPLVQAAIERGLGVAGGQHMRIEFRPGTPIDPGVTSEAAGLMNRICSVLDTSYA